MLIENTILFVGNIVFQDIERRENMIGIICGAILGAVGISYALVCINSPKMIFWEIKGITNRWMYLEEVPPIFSLWDKKEV